MESLVNYPPLRRELYGSKPRVCLRCPQLLGLRPKAHVARCIEIGIGGIVAMRALENCSGAVTYRSTDMASPGCSPRWDYLNINTFPVSFIHSKFFDFSMDPVCKLPVHSPTSFAFLRSKVIYPGRDLHRNAFCNLHRMVLCLKYLKTRFPLHHMESPAGW